MDICIKCGAKKGSKQFIELLCIECYKPSIKMPKKTVIQVCKRCGKIRMKGEWVEFDEDELGEYLGKKIKGEDVESAWVDVEEGKAYITLKKNPEVEIVKNFDLRKEVTTCITCSRKAGGYYEGLIQLRGNEYMVKKYDKVISKKLEKKTFITKKEFKKEGIDIYFGSFKEAIKIVQNLGFKFKLTKKLVGQREGKRVYRSTILIRF